MNISRIAEVAKTEGKRETETAEVRIESVDATGDFFLLRRLKVTRVTRLRSKNVCFSHELLFQDHYRSIVFENWTNLKNVSRDLLSSRMNSSAFVKSEKFMCRQIFWGNQKLIARINSASLNKNCLTIYMRLFLFVSARRNYLCTSNYRRKW